jgi:hypothetical protein
MADKPLPPSFQPVGLLVGKVLADLAEKRDVRLARERKAERQPKSVTAAPRPKE